MRAEERRMRPALSMQVPLCLVVFGFSFSKGNPIHFPFGSANVYLTVQSPFLSAEGSWLSPCGAAGSQHSSLPALIPWKCPAWMEWLLWTSRRERLSLFCLHNNHRQVLGALFYPGYGGRHTVSLPWHLDALAPCFCPAWGTAQPKPAVGGSGMRHLPSPPACTELWETHAVHRGCGTSEGGELRDNSRASSFIPA